MPRPSRLSEIARERGVDEEQLLADVLQQAEGSIDGAATILKMYPYSIRTELAHRGLRIVKDVRVRLEKVEA